jgi:hypothetical protein
MYKFFNHLIGIPLLYLGNYCMVAACWFLGREEMEKMGCIDGDHKEDRS